MHTSTTTMRRETEATPHGIPARAVDSIRRIAWQELLHAPTDVDADTEAWLAGEEV